jgi:hypothetical protein
VHPYQLYIYIELGILKVMEPFYESPETTYEEMRRNHVGAPLPPTPPPGWGTPSTPGWSQSGTENYGNGYGYKQWSHEDEQWSHEDEQWSYDAPTWPTYGQGDSNSAAYQEEQDQGTCDYYHDYHDYGQDNHYHDYGQDHQDYGQVTYQDNEAAYEAEEPAYEEDETWDY